MRIALPPRPTIPRTWHARPRVLLALHRANIPSVHGRVAGRPGPLERVMRRAAVHSHRAFSAHVRVLAMLSAGVVRHTEKLGLRQARAVEAPVRRVGQHMRVPATRQALQQRLVERLVERLIERRLRPEGTAAAPQAPVATHVRQRQPAPRIEMTMVRAQAPAALATAEPSITTPGDVRPGPHQPRVAQPAPPLALPAQELSRITDHVIRQLDHRVLSWQERTGRV